MKNVANISECVCLLLLIFFLFKQKHQTPCTIYTLHTTYTFAINFSDAWCFRRFACHSSKLSKQPVSKTNNQTNDWAQQVLLPKESISSEVNERDKWKREKWNHFTNGRTDIQNKFEAFAILVLCCFFIFANCKMRWPISVSMTQLTKNSWISLVKNSYVFRHKYFLIHGDILSQTIL